MHINVRNLQSFLHPLLESLKHQKRTSRGHQPESKKNQSMEKEEENTTAVMNDEPVRSRKHARLHRSFSHISRALIKKLHVGGGGHANTNDNDKPSSSSSSAAASFLSGCMHPRTNSFASGRCRRRQATAANDDDGALAVDFRSLRLGAAATAGVGDGGSSSLSTQDYYTDAGTSGEEGGDTDTPKAAASVVVAGGGVAVVRFSAAPYEDFWRSMREMVDAARRDDDAASPAVDWDLMEELLLCYLELNDRAVHGDILRAFADTVAGLRRRRRAVAPLPAAKTKRTRRQQQRRRAREHDLDGAKPAVVSP